MGLFGKSTQKSPRDQCKEWTTKLRKQSFLLDREIRKIQQAQDKATQELKQAAKKGNRDVCAILAKELLRSRKAKGRLHAAQSQISSISMIINEQMATVQMAGSIQRSTEVMRGMQNLISVANISHTMQDLSKEMMKTGIIGEMLDEAVEDAIDEEPIDDEVQKEVDKVMAELNVGTNTKLSEAPTAGPIRVEAEANSSTVTTEDDEYYTKMKRRLEGLKS